MENANTEEIRQGEEDWAYGYPQQRQEYIEKYSPDFPGFDKEKVLRGHILERIIGDDDGAFGTATLYFTTAGVNRKKAGEHNKFTVIRRIEWELDQKELPESLRNLLLDQKKNIQEKEWRSVEDVSISRSDWSKSIREKVLKMVSDNEEGTGDAIKSFQEFQDAVTSKGLPF